ncbi:hypothetical protein AwDysgo_18590 [Bacteroidales bacterium]|nr:hypothetical protein AwDysgo_18590 [Bacteroidales bacterium]
MKKIKYFIYRLPILGLALGLVMGIFSSCNDWLNVEPSDKILEQRLFSSEPGINAALNGIYMKMAEVNLYGNQLTVSSIEVMAQRYETAKMSDKRVELYLAKYDYNKLETTKPLIANLWKNLYSTILNTNLFIENMEKSTLLPQHKKDILLGEAYGLRAFLHFDLFRLFGPVYAANPEGLAIPYYTSSEAYKRPRLKASEVAQFLILDIDKSIELLKNDPIITEGTMSYGMNNPLEDFYRYRNHRFNYYASLMLKSRMQLYFGNPQEAAVIADQIISATEAIFPFTSPASITDSRNPDKRFSTEIIFGIENKDFKKINEDFFVQSKKSDDALVVREEILKTIFDISSDFDIYPDYRAKNWVSYRYSGDGVDPNSETKLRISNKFANLTTDTVSFKFLQPLMRISELYYIKAEYSKSLDPINTIYTARGLPDTDQEIEGLITKEYQREFFGEGQLFYYYKRKNFSQIIDGNSDNGYIPMTQENYIFPIPDAEIEN